MINSYISKITYVIIFIFAGIISSFAGPRDFVQAQKIAEQKAAALNAQISNQNIQLAKARARGTSSSQKVPPYYVFNFSDDKGYAIVSGNDCMPAIVGYSDEGAFREDSLPINIKSFLDSYKKTVEAVERNDSTVLKAIKNAMNRAKGTITPIKPLLGNIKWGQGNPFNNLCPLYDGKNRSATGCVATAMAQIMAYWRYPAELKNGIPAYTTRYYKIAIDSIPTGITYDWKNMLNHYNYPFNGGIHTIAVHDEQANAVATLMQHAGAAVKMDYDFASGAYNEDVIPALTTYFGYDKDIIKMIEKENVGQEFWDEIIQDELVKKRPILQFGINPYEGGHAFICDGIDSDGYYHINWGWDGANNGYFDVASNNFNENASIIVGIVPENYPDKEPNLIAKSKKLFCSMNGYSLENQRDPISKEFNGIITYSLKNVGEKNTFLLNIGYKDEKGIFTPIATKNHEITLNPNENIQYDFAFSYAFPNGSYKISVLASMDNGKTWEPCYEKQNDYILEVEKDYIQFTNTSSITGTEVFVDNLRFFIHQKDKTATLANNNYSGNIVIPPTVNYEGEDYTVTTIGKKCFNESTIQKVSIPETITSIEDLSFQNCQNLDSIFIPKSVTSLGDVVFDPYLNYYEVGVFARCENLRVIEFEDNSQLKKIGLGCFGKCTNLQHVNIPASVDSIGDMAFAFCDKLDSVYIPRNSSLKVIGGRAFDNSIIKYFYVPKDVKDLGSLFKTTRDAPNGTYYPSGVFRECHQLKNVEFAEDSQLQRVGDGCFAWCDSLREITLPNTVASIGEAAFAWCTNLKKINTPSSLTKLGCYAFAWSGIEEVLITQSFREIPAGCFEGCVYIKHLDLSQYPNITKLGDTSFRLCQQLEVRFNENITEIGIACFSGCQPVNLDLSKCKNLKTIGEAAFYNCQYNKEIYIPEGVTSIGSRCFNMIGWLEKLYLPSTLEEIGDSLLVGTFPEKLKDIYLPLKEVPWNFELAFTRWPADQYWPEGYNSLENCTLHVPKESVEDYKRVAKLFKAVAPLTDEETGIKNNVANKYNISYSNNMVCIDDIEIGTKVSIYTPEGVLVTSQIAQDSLLHIPCNNHSVAIVKIGNQAFKIAKQ